MQLNMKSFEKRGAQFALVVIAVFTFLGVGDENARFKDLGHHLMCVCSCNQVLLECNHVGCAYSDRMRMELSAAIDRGDNDDLTLQSFVQKYGPTVVAAPATTGFGRVAWVMPFVALLAGIATLIFIVRAWKMRPTPALADGIPPARGPELERFREQADKETGL
jgi:cytochrome c-type biogenesis protein CcmH/NrfF